MSFASHLVFLYPFLSFLISLLTLIISLFPADTVSFSHCECHREWMLSFHLDLLPLGLSTGVKLYLSVEDREVPYAVCGDRQAVPRLIHIRSRSQTRRFGLPKDTMTVLAA